MYKIPELQIYEAKADTKKEWQTNAVFKEQVVKKKKKSKKDMFNLLTSLNWVFELICNNFRMHVLFKCLGILTKHRLSAGP